MYILLYSNIQSHSHKPNCIFVPKLMINFNSPAHERYIDVVHPTTFFFSVHNFIAENIMEKPISFGNCSIFSIAYGYRYNDDILCIMVEKNVTQECAL